MADVVVTKKYTAPLVSGGMPLGTPTRTSLPEHSYQIAGQVAGEAILPFDYISMKADGKWYRNISGDSTMTNQLKGWAPASGIASGTDDMTVYVGSMNVAYCATAQSPGPLYPSASAPGGLSTGVVTANDLPVAWVLKDGFRIRTRAGA